MDLRRCLPAILREAGRHIDGPADICKRVEVLGDRIAEPLCGLDVPYLFVPVSHDSGDERAMPGDI